MCPAALVPRPCDVVLLRETAPSRSRLSSEPRTCASCFTIGTNLSVRDLGRHRGHWRFVIDFNLRIVPNRPYYLVAAGDHLVSRLQPAQDFDIGRAGDARFHFAELSLFSVHDEDALNFLFHLFDFFRVGRRRLVWLMRNQVAFLADGERLNRNGHDVLAGRGGDLSRAGEAGFNRSSGTSRAMTTLKSFASCVDVWLCDAAMPLERTKAVSPISVTCPLK